MRFISHQKRRYHGFTLIESLIALAVLAVTCSIAFPNFQKAHQATLIANESAALSSLFQLAQSRAVEESRPYVVSLVSEGGIDCIVAKAESASTVRASAQQPSTHACHQTQALMVRLDKQVTLKKQVKEEWQLQPDGDLFTIDFRTQRPNLNLTLGLMAKKRQQPDYVVQVRQYLGFSHCKKNKDNTTCHTEGENDASS
jgi:prepilin-type N-terminal cleavage/methylation domain